MSDAKPASSLFDPEIEKRTNQIIQEAAARDEAGRRAAVEPLPGPSRKAFSIDPDIVVGDYTVRPACDFDLNLLSQLNSKFYDFFMKGGDTDTLPTGPDAWELCYVMTRPAREVAQTLKKSKVSGLKQAAEDEFSFYQLRDLAQIVVAAVKQIALSCETISGHKAASNGDEEGAAKADVPPSGGPLTGLDGS